MMTTYLTLDGESLDLAGLTADERAFFDRCAAVYRAGGRWLTLARLVEGEENPLLRTTGGRITMAVMAHPLYRAVRDLEDRLGIREGEVAPMPGDDMERDPMSAGR